MAKSFYDWIFAQKRKEQEEDNADHTCPERGSSSRPKQGDQ
jgi:hypothetical protein